MNRTTIIIVAVLVTSPAWIAVIVKAWLISVRALDRIPARLRRIESKRLRGFLGSMNLQDDRPGWQQRIGSTGAPPQDYPVTTQQPIPVSPTLPNEDRHGAKHYDPEPRRRAIVAAGRYGWPIDISYVGPDGELKTLRYKAPKMRGIPDAAIIGFTVILNDGTRIPLSMIAMVAVQADSNAARRKYIVDDYAGLKSADGTVAHNHRQGVAERAIVPHERFDIEPRRQAIIVAMRYRWSVRITYMDDDGQLHWDTITLDAVDAAQVGHVRLPDGTMLSLSRIRWIEVNAATEEARRKYKAGPKW